MVPEHIHVSAHEILIRPDKSPFYLNKALKFLRKIGFKSHDVERLFSERTHSLFEVENSEEIHFRECLCEVLAVEQLLAILNPTDNLIWLNKYNEQIKCSPMDLLPSCGLAAFTMVKILLELEVASNTNTENKNALVD